MARISYVDPATVADPELAADLEHSRRYGAPRPETQAIRFHVPVVAKAFMPPGGASSARESSTTR